MTSTSKSDNIGQFSVTISDSAGSDLGDIQQYHSSETSRHQRFRGYATPCPTVRITIPYRTNSLPENHYAQTSCSDGSQTIRSLRSVNIFWVWLFNDVLSVYDVCKSALNLKISLLVSINYPASAFNAPRMAEQVRGGKEIAG